ncbi:MULTISPECIES: hypothetical protein [Roseobacteraceae]|uniref:hypothetical protein n=1 Tax=Roseobacteraceae TaxID=2854170 RepID=UPI001C461E6A|nr:MULTISPECIES: hypothetical protein [Roseobacteraceae]MBV7408992.1 hypothetical protein [Maritimibacter sp. DP1N21-5]MBY5934321.1 hypothetical protein [Tateyamaria omphalii]
MPTQAKSSTHYMPGNCDPKVVVDSYLKGERSRIFGKFNSKPETADMIALKEKMTSFLFLNTLSGLVGKDTRRHLEHYFTASGRDLDLNVENIIASSPAAHKRFTEEVGQAKAYVETLPFGRHSFASARPESAAVRKEECPNWYFAMHGYQCWGMGEVLVTPDGNQVRYDMKFTYKVFDDYDWHNGMNVTILKKTMANLVKRIPYVDDLLNTKPTTKKKNGDYIVEDGTMREFHAQGLAREFLMQGETTREFYWCKGEKIPEYQLAIDPHKAGDVSCGVKL